MAHQSIDLLMNEFGFLLIFLNLSDSYYLRHSNTLVICILRLVCFKILFNSAVHKFVNNSSQWLHLEAFQNLFFCQPIPSILSYTANRKIDKNYCSHVLFFSSFDDSILNLISDSGEAPDMYKVSVFVNFVPFFEQWNISDFKCFHLFYHIYYYFCPLNICNSYAMLVCTHKYREEIVIEELHRTKTRYEWKCVKSLNKIGSILWWGHVPRFEWKFHFFPDSLDKKNYKKNKYPIYICSFLKKLCKRDEQLASVFDDEQMRRIPLMIRLTSYDYKMSTPEHGSKNIPMVNINMEEKADWESGKYWQRRKRKPSAAVRHWNHAEFGELKLPIRQSLSRLMIFKNEFGYVEKTDKENLSPH
ncbi:lipase maturation factor, putative (LMF1) [Plasmodium ovale curtisi]|uniref:Lipase maturation factor, putative (LMF1) n=1 Tax=Plasmodium ovale curtisi TaxID=864141 RepID=A0A1A8VQF8_PLAOA|nr:lipase maturation factor, putative (LMF1) [Plasmodium ovale curtisi]